MGGKGENGQWKKGRRAEGIEGVPSHPSHWIHNDPLQPHLVDDVTRDPPAHTEGAECPSAGIDHVLFSAQHLVQ